MRRRRETAEAETRCVAPHHYFSTPYTGPNWDPGDGTTCDCGEITWRHDKPRTKWVVVVLILSALVGLGILLIRWGVVR